LSRNTYVNDLADLAHYYRGYRGSCALRTVLPANTMLEVPTRNWCRTLPLDPRMLDFIGLLASRVPGLPGTARTVVYRKQVAGAPKDQHGSIERWRTTTFPGSVAILAGPGDAMTQ